MLSRYKRASLVEEKLAEEVFHTHCVRWRPLADPLRDEKQRESARRRYSPASDPKVRRPAYWSPWLWEK